MQRIVIVFCLLGALAVFPRVGSTGVLAASDDGTGRDVAGALPLATPSAGTSPASGVTPAVGTPTSATPLPPARCDLAPTPGATPGSPAQRALDRINCYRALAGVGPLTLDDALNRAAAAHVNYYVQNAGDPSLAGMGLHEETPGRPGFTGADSDARARAAGSTDWYVDENVGLGGTPEATVDWFVNSVNHRENLLHPGTIHLGYAGSTSPPIDVFDIGVGPDRPTVPLPATYPGDRQQSVPTSVDLQETPDPAPGAPRPLGYPVTISFATQDTVTFAIYQITDPAGHPLQLYTAQKQWLRTLALIPAQPLQSDQTYTAQVTGTVNGQPFTKTWSFSTG
jgi:uncharacterized protein YkwD